MCAIKARFPRPSWAWANQRFRPVAARLGDPPLAIRILVLGGMMYK